MSKNVIRTARILGASCAGAAAMAILLTSQFVFAQRQAAAEERSPDEIARLEGHSEPVGSVAFLSENRLLSVGEAARIWDVSSGKQRRLIERKRAFGIPNADGSRILSARYKDTVILWALQTGDEIVACEGHTGAVVGGALSPDGRWAASASADGTVRLWDLQTGRELRRMAGHTGKVFAVAFTPDGKRLVSAGLDGTARVWDAATGRQQHRFGGPEGMLRGVCVSPDGYRAATAGHGRTIGVWDLRSGRALPPLSGHTDQVLCVAWSPDGKSLLSGSADKTVRLWDAETGTERHRFAGHTDQITCVAFSPDGRSAASGAGGEARQGSSKVDHSVRVWRLPAQEPSGPELVKTEIPAKLTVPPEIPFGVHVSEDDKVLVAVLELTGRTAKEATAYGHVKLEKAVDDRGTVLTLAKSRFQLRDPAREFVKLDQQTILSDPFRKPDETLRIPLLLTKPAPGAKLLKQVNGSLQLIAGGERKEVLVPAASTRIGKAIEDPALKAAGLTVRIVKPDAAFSPFGEAGRRNDPQTLAVEITGPDMNLLEVQLVDGRGRPLNGGSSWSNDGKATKYTLQSNRRLSPEVQLKLTVAVGQKALAVPFDFENVDLPARQKDRFSGQ